MLRGFVYIRIDRVCINDEVLHQSLRVHDDGGDNIFRCDHDAHDNNDALRNRIKK